jgi:hypothetical protein
VITGDSDDLIHELVLQPRGNTHYRTEDDQNHKSQSENFEADYTIGRASCWPLAIPCG